MLTLIQQQHVFNSIQFNSIQSNSIQFNSISFIYSRIHLSTTKKHKNIGKKMPRRRRQRPCRGCIMVKPCHRMYHPSFLLKTIVLYKKNANNTYYCPHFYRFWVHSFKILVWSSGKIVGAFIRAGVFLRNIWYIELAFITVIHSLSASIYQPFRSAGE